MAIFTGIWTYVRERITRTDRQDLEAWVPDDAYLERLNFAGDCLALKLDVNPSEIFVAPYKLNGSWLKLQRSKSLLSISIRVRSEVFIEKREKLEDLAAIFWPKSEIVFTSVVQESLIPYYTTLENPLINVQYLKFHSDPDDFLEIINRGENLGNQTGIL